MNIPAASRRNGKQDIAATPGTGRIAARTGISRGIEWIAPIAGTRFDKPNAKRRPASESVGFLSATPYFADGIGLLELIPW